MEPCKLRFNHSQHRMQQLAIKWVFADVKLGIGKGKIGVRDGRSLGTCW